MNEIFQTFCFYQEGRIADRMLVSGFESLQVEAYDSYGKSHQKTFPIADCKKFEKN